VAQKLLDKAQVCAMIQEMRGAGMSECVGGYLSGSQRQNISTYPQLNPSRGDPSAAAIQEQGMSLGGIVITGTFSEQLCPPGQIAVHRLTGRFAYRHSLAESAFGADLKRPLRRKIIFDIQPDQ